MHRGRVEGFSGDSLRISSTAASTKEILDGLRRRKRKKEKARHVWSFKGQPRDAI